MTEDEKISKQLTKDLIKSLSYKPKSSEITITIKELTIKIKGE